MNKVNEQVAFWATIVSLLLGIFTTFQQGFLYFVAGLSLLALSFFSFFYVLYFTKKVKRASISIDGLRIDSLNLANLERCCNDTLVVKNAKHKAIIDKYNLYAAWNYSGHCRGKLGESGIEFSIDSDSNNSLQSINCYGYDLIVDPEKKNKISPFLIGPEGMSKKIKLPFLKHVGRGDRFDVMLRFFLKNCMALGRDYYISTLSFSQKETIFCTVTLFFVEVKPEWVRVYEISPQGDARFIKSLALNKYDEERDAWVFEDIIAEAPARFARIYMFLREKALK